jgi:ATP-dependent DNA helicase DinG
MQSPAAILGPTGAIARRLPHYEQRQQQLEMADAVSKALAERQHLLVEAGTGVGKSFAYLVPAILAATAEREPKAEPLRIVISTHTIALQEQLMQKDIPLLKSVMPQEFTAVLVKGRGNYLSLRRMGNAEARASSLFHSPDEFKQLRDIVAWSKETGGGSLAELDHKPMPGVWDEVQSESGNCMGRNCPTYKDCFYYRARRRVQHAQILVVNHALFFSDLALRREDASILPDYQAVIFDEAHTVESVASNHLGVSITSGQVEYLLNKLYNDHTNKGLLVGRRQGAAEQEVMSCRMRADDFFAGVEEWLQPQNKQSARVPVSEIVENRLSPSLTKLSQMVRAAGQGLKDDEKQDFSSAADRLTTLAALIEDWRMQRAADSVYWVEASRTRRGRTKITLESAPIDVGPALRTELFNKCPTVVLTSATLSVGQGGSFDFIKSRIGLTQSQSERFGSPFDYQRQAELIVLEGMPDPGDKAAYERACIEMIQRYVARSDGHAFALFTSYDMLSRCAAQLQPWLTRQNLALFSQADGVPRSQMLAKFKANPRALLLGTDSFWQGVDVPGDALTNVIITKLPFSVPDQPLLEARLEAIRNRGGVPFTEYQLPEAVLKLKQGFGRLIRSQRDHGMVVILDPRVKTKPYGKLFLDSLPDCRRVVEMFSGERLKGGDER